MGFFFLFNLITFRISSHQRILSDALSNFQTSDDQVTIEVSSQTMLLRNYVDTSADLSKVIRTQICLKQTEFDTYIIGVDTKITFTMKEFRALLAFAEALNLPIQLHFETTGRPAVFIVHNGSTFEAHFVLATSKSDNTTQATSTQNSRTERKRKDTTKDSARKMQHTDIDISKCLDEDSHLFNFIDIPVEIPEVNGIDRLRGNKDCMDRNCDLTSSKHLHEAMDCDNIPGSPTSRTMIKSVFRRCFELTFDPKSIQGNVIAENSDSE